MGRFEGKCALGTGGTSGIGLATALRIAREGGRVAVTGRDSTRLAAVKGALPADSLVIANDASIPEAAVDLGEAIETNFGQLELVFLNAGILDTWPVGAAEATRYDRLMSVNMRAPALHISSLESLLADDASVLLTSSVAAFDPSPEGAAYAASKVACATMAKAWAREFAERGIRVNSICPGMIDTNLFDEYHTTSNEREAFLQDAREKVPLARPGTPGEIAAVACFLLSDEASYVTGTEWVVDGGLTLR